MTLERVKSGAAALFFLLLAVVGLVAGGDYGLPCDETTEQVILEENMLEYALRLFGEDSAPARWYQSRGITPISQSIERDHGQCAYYLAAALLPMQQEAPDRVMVLWHAYTWLWFMLGVAAVYGFCREAGLSRIAACGGMLLLYLCPRFFAEGHYNSKDMVLMTLFLCTLWLGLRLLKKPGFLRGALFSLAGAMAANTKVVGFFVWGLMGLCAVVLVTAQRGWNRRMACVAAATAALFIAFYALLTPAMWSGPMDYLRYLLVNASGFTRWPGVVLFRGMRFEHAVNPLPRYYLIWMMLVTLPLYVAPLAAVGQLSALRRVWRQRAAALRDPVSLALTAASLCWFVPLLFAVLTRPLVYNGWRHFYFVYAGVVLLSAQGLSACMAFLRRRTGEYGMHRVFAAGLCLFFAWTAWDIAKNHPYQYAYYNRLGHENAQEEMELDYWVVSTRNAMQRLLTEARDETLPLQISARDDMSLLGLERSHATLSNQEREAIEVTRDENAPYLFSNTTYAVIYGVEPPEGYHVLFALESYSVPIATVYERD